MRAVGPLESRDDVVPGFQTLDRFDNVVQRSPCRADLGIPFFDNHFSGPTVLEPLEEQRLSALDKSGSPARTKRELNHIG
jgi:hypothetical protein